MEADHIPTLIQLIYGEQATLGAEGASERLRRWSAAFEGWLESYPQHQRPQLIVPWRGLLASSRKLPWGITTQDVRAYLDALQARGYVDATIHKHRRYLDRFFDWCQLHAVDGPVFNPVKEVPTSKLVNFKKVASLSVKEAAALLAALRKDDTVLGKRDYAFFLSRLLLGVPLQSLLGLKWGQIEVEGRQARVLWSEPKAKRERLPEAVWAAMRDYLEASGRWQCMQADDHIFAPLADPLNPEGRDRAQAWNPGVAIHYDTMRFHLKKFGRLAGIPEEKLRLTVLRHTAAMLRLETGQDIQGIQAFLGKPTKKGTSRYLKVLAALGQATPGASLADGAGPAPAGIEPGPPQRVPGRKIKHGLKARQQPEGEMAAILAEKIEGLEQEIQGLQRLNQELFEMFDLAESNRELAHLLEISGRSEARLAEMLRANKELAERERRGSGEDELRARLEKLARDLGSSLEAWGPPGTGAPGEGDLAYSIARLRLALRRILALVETSEDITERARYIDMYGVTCVKLVKLLRVEVEGGGSLFAWWREALDEALAVVVEQLGLEI